MNDYPSVLLVTETPPGSANGCGVTLETLFANWPSNKLRCFFTEPDFQNDFQSFPNYTFAHVPNSPGRKFSFPFFLGLNPEWRGKFSSYWLRRALKNYRPNLVYSMVCSIPCLLFAFWIANKINVPLVPHIADDPFNGNYSEQIRLLFKNSKSPLAISEKMASHYQDNLGIPFDYIHNAPQKEFFRTDHVYEERSYSKDNPFIIRFLGGYYPYLHEDAMQDIVGVVENLNQLGYSILFEFHGYDNPRGSFNSFSSNIIRNCGPFKNDDSKVKLYHEADLLVIPASFRKESYDHYQYSIPTKLTECLASAVPTLCYGPDGMAAVQFCKNHDLGICISSKDPDVLKTSITNIYNDPLIYKTKAKENSFFIKENFSAEIIQRKFQRLLSNSAKIS